MKTMSSYETGSRRLAAACVWIALAACADRHEAPCSDGCENDADGGERTMLEPPIDAEPDAGIDASREVDASRPMLCSRVAIAGADAVPLEDRAHGDAITVACGLNDRGLKTLRCENGEWVPSTCRDPDTCRDGETGAKRCGLNQRGAIARTCRSGVWAESECVDPDMCTDGDARQETCGLNGHGHREFACADGDWLGAACIDPDECTDGDAKDIACGLNGRGSIARTCVAGAWRDRECADPDECTDGESDARSCGVLGVGMRECTSGTWSEIADCDAPLSLTISAAGIRDMVHDAKRSRLYITTAAGSSGAVLVYDLASRELEPPLLTGGGFYGIDLSPNEDRLIVADSSIAEETNYVHVIDLESGDVDPIEFQRESSEGGTYSVVFLSDDEALVSSNFQGSGWVPLRRVDLGAGTAMTIRSVRQSTMLVAAAGGDAVAFAESNISSGAFGVYTPSANGFLGSGTGWFVYDVAISRNAEQVSVPTYGGLFVYNAALGDLETIGQYATTLAVGAVYSPVADELYLAWMGADVSLDVYDMETLERVRTIEPEPGMFSWTGNGGFGSGRMRVSRDGRLLFASTGNGAIKVYPTGL
jgi:hypothetical protein